MWITSGAGRLPWAGRGPAATRRGPQPASAGAGFSEGGGLGIVCGEPDHRLHLIEDVKRVHFLAQAEEKAGISPCNQRVRLDAAPAAASNRGVPAPRRQPAGPAPRPGAFPSHGRKRSAPPPSVLSARTDEVIRRLNEKLRGWGYQFRHLVASRAFGYIDNQIFESLKRWTRRRHPEKNVAWRKRKYFRADGDQRWIFTASYRTARGKLQRVDLVRLSRLGLRRHAKIQGKAHPFDPAYSEYFRHRWLSKRRGRGGQPAWSYA